MRAFEHWVDISSTSDDAAASRIRDDGIDVLVELKGHTAGSRLGIVCRRPAPIQIHYLGFPGTLGLDAISHLVADAVIAPPADEAGYHETLVRMPDCYQVNDDRRALPNAPARSALGLPDDELVLACLNHSAKLSRTFFRLWAQAMREVPRSVLWLYVPHEVARRNLRVEAEREGLDPRASCSLPRRRTKRTSRACAWPILRSTCCHAARTLRAATRCGLACRCCRAGVPRLRAVSGRACSPRLDCRNW